MGTHRIHVPLEISNSMLSALAKLVDSHLGFESLDKHSKGEISDICSKILNVITTTHTENPKYPAAIPGWSVYSYLGVTVRNKLTQEIGYISSAGILNRTTRTPILHVFSAATHANIHTITSLKDLYKNFELLTAINDMPSSGIERHLVHIDQQYNVLCNDGSVQLSDRYDVGLIGMITHCVLASTDVGNTFTVKKTR